VLFTAIGPAAAVARFLLRLLLAGLTFCLALLIASLAFGPGLLTAGLAL